MTYTFKQSNIFRHYFTVTREYMVYKDISLGINGLQEPGTIEDTYYETTKVEIHLSNGKTYQIDYGMSYEAEDQAILAFNKLLELNEDEAAWEEYLQTETIFELA